METDDVVDLNATPSHPKAYTDEEMDYSDEDGEIPEISVNELLDDMENMTLDDPAGKGEADDNEEDYEL